MTAPEPVLTAAETLEGLYGLTGSELGLDEQRFAARLGLWERLAAQQRPDAPAFQQASVRAMALRAWVTALIGKADKFRAEGDITVERDVMARIGLVKAWLLEAEAEALPPVSSSADTFGPVMDWWGVEP